MKSKLLFFFLLCLTLLLNNGCEKKNVEKLEDRHIIPYVPIYTVIDLGVGGESQLEIPGQPLYQNISRPYGMPLGYNENGIIIIRLSDTEYACWDATCTNCQDLHSHFTQDQLDGEIAECPVCNTQFSLRYGTPFNANEKIYPLKSYPIHITTNKLIVSY